MKTISPRARVGARLCVIEARKISPVIGPLATSAATMASWRRTATKVMVFQCPCGASPTYRTPRGQRPLSRTMTVVAQLSSTNTSRAWPNMPCSLIQRRRARARSARFCSAAWICFFLKLIGCRLKNRSTALPLPVIPCVRLAARISTSVKSGCAAISAISQSACASSGEILPPLGLAATLRVASFHCAQITTVLAPIP
jgi:hypothetical protein